MEKASAAGLRLSVKETALRLGVTSYTVRRFLSQRLLAHHRVGRRIVLDERDVETFFQAGRIEARKKDAR